MNPYRMQILERAGLSWVLDAILYHVDLAILYHVDLSNCKMPPFHGIVVWQTAAELSTVGRCLRRDESTLRFAKKRHKCCSNESVCKIKCRFLDIHAAWAHRTHFWAGYRHKELTHYAFFFDKVHPGARLRYQITPLTLLGHVFFLFERRKLPLDHQLTAASI